MMRGVARMINKSIIGIAETAELLGLTQSTIRYFVFTRKFPTPKSAEGCYLIGKGF
jgi:predicted DNA-binding transcriptional regulator AlpA